MKGGRRLKGKRKSRRQMKKRKKGQNVVDQVLEVLGDRTEADRLKEERRRGITRTSLTGEGKTPHLMSGRTWTQENFLTNS